jgi:phosphohistidine phosphatase
VKTLYLLRHAKSSRDDPDLDDFERPLAKRGRKDAALIGRLMAERRRVPDLALVSPALRARDTWERVSSAFAASVETRFEPSIYMATADGILALLRAAEAAPDAPQSVIVVGHNPGLEQCAAQLAGAGSDPEALARMTEKFPTTALARYDVTAGLQTGGAALVDFVRPKDLRS